MQKHIDREIRHMRMLAAIAIIAGTVFIFGGAQLHGSAQNISWEIANMLSVAAYSIIIVILARNGYDLVTAEFGLLVAAQGFAIASTANIEHMDVAAYAAAFILYIPGYLIIAAYSGFMWWIRLSCVLVCIPLAYETYEMLSGIHIRETGFVNYSVYIFRAIVDIGLIITLLKSKKEERLY